MSLFYKYALPSIRSPFTPPGSVNALLGWRSRAMGVHAVQLSPTEAQARYLTWVLNYAAMRVGPGPDAEDVCAETWAAAFAIWHRCPRPSHSDSADDPIRAWLCGIARRKVADTLRQRERTLPQASESEAASAPSPAPGPEWSVLSSEAAQLLRAAIDALPPDQAESLRLHYGDGLSLADIGKVLHRSPAAVGMLLSRARASVRAAIAPYFAPPSEEEITQ